MNIVQVVGISIAVAILIILVISLVITRRKDQLIGLPAPARVDAAAFADQSAGVGHAGSDQGAQLGKHRGQHVQDFCPHSGQNLAPGVNLLPQRWQSVFGASEPPQA